MSIEPDLPRRDSKIKLLRCVPHTQFRIDFFTSRQAGKSLGKIALGRQQRQAIAT